jgi:transketolase
MEIYELQKHANNIRKKILYMVKEAQSGHPGGSLSAADIITELYFEVMDVNESNLESKERDRFVLSKGHASPALYAVLDEKGLLNEDLATFRKLNSKLQGHPSMSLVKGVDYSTGSLGQGISGAVGMALSNKIDGNDYKVYALLGDGECEEGEVWEAAMAAAHYNLDNLCAIVDFNSLQIDGKVQDVMNPTPIDEKFKAFGWYTLEADGHDFDSLRAAFAKANEVKGQPVMILAHTIKGKGVSFMENAVNWHGVAPNQEQYEKAIMELEDVNNG